MDIINKRVRHDSFGEGNIVNCDEGFIEVEFEDGIKKFLFPDAFKSFLTILDEEAADELEELIVKTDIKREEEEEELEKKKMQKRKERKRLIEVEKFMKSNKLHPSSQIVFWCEEDEIEDVFSNWTVFTGIIKSGNKEGEPNRPARLHQNSACLITTRGEEEDEENRKILGLYMVNETFTGHHCEDGYIPAHTTYRVRLSPEETEKMPFWKYYSNKRYPENTTWNTGRYRYFENTSMAQILLDVLALKEDSEEKTMIQEFLNHFCRMNKLDINKIPAPNGALVRRENPLEEATN